MDDEERRRRAHENYKRITEKLQTESLQVADHRGRAWTRDEDNLIRAARQLGVPASKLCKKLHRSYHATRLRMFHVKTADEAGAPIIYADPNYDHGRQAEASHYRRQRPPCNCATLDPDLHEDWCSSYSTEEEV